MEGRSKNNTTPEQINNEYNNNYMRTEFVYTVRAARMAQRWQEFEANKHVYPYLEYMPSTAAEPRMEHQKFYGVIKHIDDPFWDTWLPPNGWGCKCSVRPVRSNIGSKELPEKDKMPPEPPEFMQQNPAKNGVIFNDEASYFKKIDEKFSKEKAQQVKTEFELLKETIPYELVYQSKGKVYTHLFADKKKKKEYNYNLETAKLIADNEQDVDIRVRPHLFVDGIKNPEFLINDIIADQTIYNPIKSKSIDNFINNSFNNKFSSGGQLSKGGILVLNFKNFTNKFVHKKSIMDKLKQYKNCIRVYVIVNNKVEVF